MKVSPFFIVVFFPLIAGCSGDSNNEQGKYFGDSSNRYVPVVRNCELSLGTVFDNCVSNDWFPTYWRSPINGEGGREVRADENLHHYVQVQVLAAEKAARKNVLDVRYGYEPSNASLRFKPSGSQTGFTDLSEFSEGSLQFDIRVLDWGFASDLNIRVECGWPCSSDPVNRLLAPIGEWHSIEISADELVKQGLDMSRIDSVINISPTWNQPQGVHYQLDNIRWVQEPAGPPAALQERDWAKLARLDLDFIYQAALENHPGAIDDSNPGFRAYLESGYREALVSLDEVKTMRGYANLLLSYMAGFDDGHFKVVFPRLPGEVLRPHSSVQQSRGVSDYSSFASIEPLQEGVYWVYLPTFLELDHDQRKAMHQVIEQLQQLPEDSIVVFDVRWNGGGDSTWGWRVLEGLYGSSFMKRLYVAEGGAEHSAEFRVSKGNADFHKHKAASLGAEHPGYESVIRRYEGIQDALQEGRDWYAPDSGSAIIRWLLHRWYSFGSLDSSITPVLLSSEGCASACLDFADLVVRLPNARHFGRETSSDTLYMDVRIPRQQLPSGLGKLTLPMKVFRQRFRGHNESYMPDVVYEGDIYDTEAVQAWVLDTLR